MPAALRALYTGNILKTEVVFKCFDSFRLVYTYCDHTCTPLSSLVHPTPLHSSQAVLRQLPWRHRIAAHIVCKWSQLLWVPEYSHHVTFERQCSVALFAFLWFLGSSDSVFCFAPRRGGYRFPANSYAIKSHSPQYFDQLWASVLNRNITHWQRGALTEIWNLTSLWLQTNI